MQSTNRDIWALLWISLALTIDSFLGPSFWYPILVYRIFILIALVSYMVYRYWKKRKEATVIQPLLFEDEIV